MNKQLIAVFGLVAGLAVAGPAQAVIPQTVADASFEAPVTGDYTYGPVVPGVVFSNGAGVSSGGSFGFTAPDGNQVGFLQGLGTIAVKFTGTLIKGAIYTLTFDAAGRGNGYGINDIGVSVHGKTIDTVTSGELAANTFGTYTTNFKYYGDNTVKFAGLTDQGANAANDRSTDYTSAIDNIRVDLFAAPVPEPASWALMIGGFGMVGGAMRRRRKASTVVFA